MELNLDHFQLEAIKYTNNFQTNPVNILVCAPTGSGKTKIAINGILEASKKNKKVIYTSPLKALSNQKFNEFNKLFVDNKITVGIKTGDHKFAPNSQCIICTTEILLNDLKNNLDIKDVNFDEVGTIIFDEVHYINDLDRGKKWEECIMLIPNHIHIIMLSATLKNPDNFAKWIELIQKKPTIIITNLIRPVPLYFKLIYKVNEQKISNDLKNKIDYNSLISIYDTDSNFFNEIKYNKVLKFHDLYSKKNYFTDKSILNSVLVDFKNSNEEMFPLLIFILNKRKCLETANAINIIFNNHETQLEIEQFIKEHIKLMNAYYLEEMEQFIIIKKLILNGIGIHHSGLLPILKEIIEILYDKKYIKVLIATETFAVGLNMPTKTVIFTDLHKYSADEFRLFLSHEFIQMAGRAGRRNIDTKGYVILLPQLFHKYISSFDLKQLFNNGSQIITSKFSIDTSFILKYIIHNNKEINKDQIIEYINTSMLGNTILKNISYQKNMLNEIEKEYNKIDKIDLDNIENYNQILQKLNHSYMKLNKAENLLYKNLSANKHFLKILNIYTKYEKINKLYINLLNNISLELDETLNLLLKYDMISIINDNITLINRGIIGSYITDIDPILCTDIITHPNFITLNEINILLIFSIIIFDETAKERVHINDIENDEWKSIINDLIKKYENNKDEFLIDTLNFDFIELFREFLETGNYPSNKSKYYLFEGNFIRMTNRLTNLLNEIKLISEVTKNITLMNIICNCINIIESHQWLKPDSIYLRMSNIII